MATLIRIGLGPTPIDVFFKHLNGARYVNSEALLYLFNLASAKLN